MQTLLDQLIAMSVSLAGKLLLSLFIFFAGRFLIRKLISVVTKIPHYKSLDPTVQRFLFHFISIALYCVLFISIIAVLGVPMASIITLLASAGLAIGTALQGGLSNLAGGIMLLIFRPFSADDYITAGDVSGTVLEVSIFYTRLLSADLQEISIPNGSLMNNNVINHTAHPTRRIALSFTCSRAQNYQQVKDALMPIVQSQDGVLKDPEPELHIVRITDTAAEYSLRVWSASSQYWYVANGLMDQIPDRMREAGLLAPAVTIQSDPFNQ